MNKVRNLNRFYVSNLADSKEKNQMGAQQENDVVTRPGASPGYWLCALIPMAYLVSGFRYPNSSNTYMYKFTVITALGLNLQAVTYFLHLNTHCSRMIRFFYAFLPGVITAGLLMVVLQQNFLVSIFWGVGFPLGYHIIYLKTLKELPKSFTFGEASIMVQGFILFVLNAIQEIPYVFKDPPKTEFSQMCAIMMVALSVLGVACLLVWLIPMCRTIYLFYPLMVVTVVIICIVPVAEEPAIITLVNFITSDLRRVFLIVLFAGLTGFALSAVSWQVGKSSKASTIVRKIFHLLVVCVFIPGLVLQCTLMYIASGVGLAFLIVLEMLRLVKLPPFGEALNSSFEVFADEKDAGIVALTPFYLLVGCSIPMWISPNSCSLTDTAGDNLIPLLSGVLSIGIGDTAASTAGTMIGRFKIPGTKKSVEGVVASIVLQGLTVYALIFPGLIKLSISQLTITSVAIVFTSILEALTDQVDNIIVPLVFFIISSLS